jgi:hypothetical protein
LPDSVKRNPVTRDLFAASEVVKVHIVFEVSSLSGITGALWD